jgi:hypothetical protein
MPLAAARPMINGARDLDIVAIVNVSVYETRNPRQAMALLATG